MARVFQQVRRAQVLGHQDGVVGQVALTRMVARHQPQQAVGQVLEVVQPLADIGIAGVGEAGAVLVADAVDGGLCGQARAHRLFQRPVPAPVVGEHPIGLQHLIGGAAQLALTAFQQGVDAGAQTFQRRLEPDLLGDRIVGQKLFGRDRRLVQHGPAERQAFGELLPPQPFGPMGRHLDVAKLLQRQKLARGHRLGQDHGDGLDVLDLFLVIATGDAVLDDQDPDGPAAAQQGRAEEGVIGVFARFRPIGEAGVRLGVRQAQRFGRAGHLADQTLAGTQAGVVNGLGVQPLGGEQLQLARGAPQIDGADLGHHRAGDDPHHHVQPVLSGRAASRPGQGLADLAQQEPWPPRRHCCALDHSLSRLAALDPFQIGRPFRYPSLPRPARRRRAAHGPPALHSPNRSER